MVKARGSCIESDVTTIESGRYGLRFFSSVLFPIRRRRIEKNAGAAGGEYDLALQLLDRRPARHERLLRAVDGIARPEHLRHRRRRQHMPRLLELPIGDDEPGIGGLAKRLAQRPAKAGDGAAERFDLRHEGERMRLSEAGRLDSVQPPLCLGDLVD